MWLTPQRTGRQEDTQTDHSSSRDVLECCSSGVGLCNGQDRKGGEHQSQAIRREREIHSGPEEASAEENQGLELLKKLINQ